MHRQAEGWWQEGGKAGALEEAGAKQETTCVGAGRIKVRVPRGSVQRWIRWQGDR